MARQRIPSDVEELQTPDNFEPLMRLNRDLRHAGTMLGRKQIRSLVDVYYNVQHIRKITDSQERAARDSGEPNRLLEWTARNWRLFESDIKKSFFEFANSYTIGKWAMSIVGIGEVLSAGLMAYLELRDTVGHWYSFGGYDPRVRWLGKEGAKQLMQRVDELDPHVERELQGDSDETEMCPPEVALVQRILGDGESQLSYQQVKAISEITFRRVSNIVSQARDDRGNLTRSSMLKFLARRPWNANLKVLYWKIGDCFVKNCNREGQFYGTIYHDRKEYEESKNRNGDYKSQAEESLQKFDYGKDTEAYKWYSKGMLPPGRIHLRCLRYTVKLFLSHFHHVYHLDATGNPPPVPIQFTNRVPGSHTHWIAPPNIDLRDIRKDFPGKSVRELRS